MAPRTADHLVVDASVAAKWHLPDEQDGEIALALLERFQDGRVALIAPAFINYEVPNAIAVATRGASARLNRLQGEAAINAFLRLGLPTEDDESITGKAYDLMHEYGIALYDGLYVALAQRLGVPCITADRRLYQRTLSLPDVLWIADWQPLP